MMKSYDREEMRKAIMELVDEAQGKKPGGSPLHVVRKDDRSLAYKLGSAVGIAAYYMTRIFIHPVFIALCTAAVVYVVLRLAGISVEIVKAGEVLLRIR